jgi:hypothetical protein
MKPASSAVRAGKEVRIPELRRFIAQAGEVLADLVAEPVGAKSQPHGSTGVVGEAETRAKNSGGSCGRQTNEISAVHGCDCITGLRRGATLRMRIYGLAYNEKPARRR